MFLMGFPEGNEKRITADHADTHGSDEEERALETAPC
jgi:hypothetical protein